MLNTIHSLAKGFGAKLLLVLLVLSFAVWGIGDMINAPARNQTVAKVGDLSVSEGTFRQSLGREAEKIRRALGDDYSPQVLADLKIPQQVLKMMVGQLLMQQEVGKLGLSIPDDAVAKFIRNNPAFQDGKGNFNKEMLRQRLANAGLTEKAFIEQLRRQETSKMVLDSLTAETAVHDAAVKTLYLSRNQKRDVSIYVLDSSMMKDVKTPGKEAVETFYKENSQLFMVPEYRTISYLTFTADNVKKIVTVSDADIEAAYEERLEEFRHEERRTVEQLLYSTEDKAKEAAAMAKEGKSFAEVAEATNAVNKKSLSIGTITQKTMFEGAGEKVFALAEKDISEPIQSPFGWHVFRVAKIEPASVDSLEMVHDKLKKDVMVQKQEEAIGTFANTLEDTFAAGGTLQDVSKEHGLSVTTLPAIDRQGKTADGRDATLPKLDKFLDIAFKLDEKTESSVTFAKGGTYYVLRADKIEAERVRPLEEVMDQATRLATQALQQVQLANMITDLAAEFADPAKRSGVINRYGIAAKPAESVKRTDSKIAGLQLPEIFVADMFVRGAGDATAAYALPDGSYAIAVVKNIIPAALPSDASAFATTRKDVAHAFTNEIMDEYMSSLAARYPVEIEAGKINSVKVE